MAEIPKTCEVEVAASRMLSGTEQLYSFSHCGLICPLWSIMQCLYCIVGVLRARARRLSVFVEMHIGKKVEEHWIP